MNQTFYIFRHGMAVQPQEEYGDTIFTAGLLPEGKAAIEKIGEYMKDKQTDFNTCSSIPRCRQSAEIVEKITGKHFAIDKRINEYFDEPFEKVRERVKSFFDEITNRQYKSILICTHGAIMGALKHIILEGDFVPKDLLEYPPSGSMWIFKNNTLQLLDFNSLTSKEGEGMHSQ